MAIKIREQLHNIEVVDKDTPVKEFFDIIWNEHPDALIVIESGKVVGIVTDSDIIMKVRKGDLDSRPIKAKDIMSSPVVSIDVNKDIKEAIELMVKNNIQKLLVTGDEVPLGVLYGEDILELDEEKWKEIIFNQTVEEVYKILLATPNADLQSVAFKIKEMDKFANMESKVEFDLLVYQEGIILVAYNYIRENTEKPLPKVKEEIKSGYGNLLEKYSKQED